MIVVVERLMASVTIRLRLDPEDSAAFHREVERIAMAYGYPPAPHLKTRFEEELDRAVSAAVDCMFLPVLD